MSFVNRKINVLYLTWGEVVVASGIFNNLIFEQLKGIKETGEINLFAFSGIPIVNKTLFSSYNIWKEELKKLKERFKQESIPFYYTYLLFPSFWFVTKVYFLPLMYVFYLNTLKRYIKKLNIDVVHCRGYHSTIMSLLCKRLFKLKFKIVFDTRGNFPEEGILLGSFSERSLSFKAWKKIEKWLFKNVDCVVNVSEEFNRYVRKIEDKTPVVSIPASINLEPFIRYIDKEIEKRKMGINSDVKILAYLGDISLKGYHRIEIVAEVYKRFKLTFSNTKLLIISKSDPEYIKNSLRILSVDKDDYMIVEGRSIQDTSRLLKLSDYAVFPYRNVRSAPERLMANTMIGSKLPEYLAAGLPVISNKEVTAVSNIIEKNGLGLTFIRNEIEYMDKGIIKLSADYDGTSNRCTHYAKQFFDVKQSSRRYVDVF